MLPFLGKTKNLSTIPKVDLNNTTILRVDGKHTTISSVDNKHTTIPRVDHKHTTIPRVDSRHTTIPRVDSRHTTIPRVDHKHTTIPRVDHKHTTIPRVDHKHTTIPRVDHKHTTIPTVDHKHTIIPSVDHKHTTIPRLRSLPWKIRSSAEAASKGPSTLATLFSHRWPRFCGGPEHTRATWGGDSKVSYPPAKFPYSAKFPTILSGCHMPHEQSLVCSLPNAERSHKNALSVAGTSHSLSHTWATNCSVLAKAWK